MVHIPLKPPRKPWKPLSGEINYEHANNAAKELVRGCIVVGLLFLAAAMYLVWFGGIYDDIPTTTLPQG